MVGKINWNPTKRDLRSFGIVILIGFGLIGLWAAHKGWSNAAHRLWAGAALIFVLSFVLPVAAKPFYMVWMGFGAAIGFVMSRIVLTIIFYFVLTPVALVFKIIKRDGLGRFKNPTATTYWNDHPAIEDKSAYKHLF